MAVDYFLKLDGIEGESQDSKHKGEIDIMSFSFGATNSGSLATGGGGGAGRVQFSGFHFTKGTDKASPKLFLGCATGQHIKTGVLVARKAGGDGQGFEFLKLTLSDILVSSFQSSGSGGDNPTESLSLNFTKIEFQYTQQNADGAALSPISAGWDLKQNKAV